jgi:hypothetical protein
MSRRRPRYRIEDDYPHDDEDQEAAEIMSETSKETPQGLQISLTIGNYEMRGIENAVVQAVGRSFEKRLEKAVEDLIGSKIEEAIAERAKALVGEFIQRPRQRTNTYGEATGDKVTALELIMDNFQKYMKQRVEADGRMSHYQDGGQTREDWLISQIGTKAVHEAVQAEVARIGAHAKEKIKETVATYIAQQLAPTITMPALKG